MPDLIHLYSNYDSGLLKIIAETWGIEISELDEIPINQQVIDGLLKAARSRDLTADLPDPAREALSALAAGEGRLPVPVFVRRFGDIRVMGAGKRDRERPDQNPSSPAEVLWYAGLIGKAFLDARPAPQEFVFIPDDLRPYLSLTEDALPAKTDQVYGRPAAVDLIKHVHPAHDRILDEACTLLAALRMGLDLENTPGFKAFIPLPILKALLTACGLLDEHAIPIPESTRQFLEAPRSEALSNLFSCWRKSHVFNELMLLPGLSFEGLVHNDPLHTREHVLDFLAHAPREGWVDLASFVSDVHDLQPDFQRPAGDYDSWFIRRKTDQAFLRGFASWDEVDGALLRFIVSGLLHWLGVVELASVQNSPAHGSGKVTAFRLSTWAERLLSDQPPDDAPETVKALRLDSDGRVSVPRECPRAIRYQIARASRWLPGVSGEYRYQITPNSLEHAAGQGLKASYLISILRRHHQGPLPPNFLQAMERWEKFGVQARVQTVEVVSFQDENILSAVRASPAGRYLLDTINPVSAVVRPGSKNKLMRALLDLGYLSSDSGEIQKGEG